MKIHFKKLLLNAFANVILAGAFFYTSATAGDDIILGRAIFNRMWTQAPSSTQAADGLGPLFNARACVVCHNNGRKGTIKKGKYPRLLFRLNPDPVYGTQFQPFAVSQLEGEGEIRTTYTDFLYTLPDGQSVSLREPSYKVIALNYGAMIDDSAISPRSAPSLRGVGLLALIPNADILKNADLIDSNKDGISGRVHMVKNMETGKMDIGRFGWKAIHPTVRQQNAGAAMGDIGLSTPLLPKGAGECTDNQEKCLAMPTGNSPQYDNLELPSNIENLMLTYVLNLKVDSPKRKTKNSKGEDLFSVVGCNKCHTPSYRVAGKEINPYTDLLLHDMGDRLADNVQEGDAKGNEWKTPALWGNNKKTRKSNPYFLHDGRARNILEAILWHDGEAKKSRESFEKLKYNERESLIKFVESL